MTSFVTSDIPSSINTLEKLAVWCSTALNNINPSLTVIETSGAASFAADSTPFFVTASATPEWRNISRLSIKLNANWQRTGKIWVHAEELSTTVLPADFRS